jgi:hypothetical protein
MGDKSRPADCGGWLVIKESVMRKSAKVEVSRALSRCDRQCSMQWTRGVLEYSIHTAAVSGPLKVPDARAAHWAFCRTARLRPLIRFLAGTGKLRLLVLSFFINLFKEPGSRTRHSVENKAHFFDTVMLLHNHIFQPGCCRMLLHNHIFQPGCCRQVPCKGMGGSGRTSDFS